MSSVVDEAGSLTEEERVELMTFERLRDLGFSTRQAAALAAARVSWHDADALLSAGCAVPTAFDILS